MSAPMDLDNAKSAKRPNEPSVPAPLARPRVHFGSIEEQERQKRAKSEDSNEDDNGVSIDDLEEDSGMDLSESSVRAREKHQAVLDEFERKKRARSIAVPTDDGRVRAKLRELGEPQCLFGEGPGDRRDRLRFFLSKMEGTDAMEVEEEESESESDEEKEEEFYTPGTQGLLEARRWMVMYSLPRAQERLARQRTEHEFPLPQLKGLRKDLHTHLKAYANYGSQIVDDRPISQCSFSPDSKMVATGAWSGICKVWSVPNCECLYTLRGHNDRVGGVEFHPQSTISLDRAAANLASGAADGTVHLWSFDRDTPLARLSGHTARVARVGFHPSGRYLGTASYDGTWRLWDVETTQELLLQEGHSREVYTIAFQDDGALVASGGLDSIGRVWDLRTGRSAMTLEGHVKDVLALDFSPNGYQVASGSADNTIRIWDVRTLRSIYTIPAHKSLVADLKFFHQSETVAPNPAQPSVTGLYLVSAGYDGSVKVWSADDWRLLKSLDGHDGKVMGVDVAKDGQFIVSSGFDRTFKLWANENMAM